MTVSAHDVAAAIRTRLPGCPVKKLHKLLYYAQGHHLAATGQPLFAEPISAWDMGPVVGTLWHTEKNAGPVPEPSKVDAAAMNTVGYVCSRYGKLTGLDLEHLTHAEDPWRRADKDREPGGSTRIELQWMHDYFRDADVYEEDEPMPDPEELAAFRAAAAATPGQRPEPTADDDLPEIRARLAAARGA